MTKKTALIIGGSGDIGSAIAQLLLDKNYKVCVTFLNTKNSIKDSNVQQYKMDLQDEQSIINTMEHIKKDNKIIDAVVFAQGSEMIYKNVEKLDWSDFEAMIDVYTKGTFLIIKSLIDQIKIHKTKFVVISTEYCSGRPPARLLPYITAKYSQLGLIKSMLADLSQYKATFNIVSPGMTETKFIKKLPSKLIEINAANNPLKRNANPKDIANTVAFFIDDESDYLNGANVMVNGGNVLS